MRRAPLLLALASALGLGLAPTAHAAEFGPPVDMRNDRSRPICVGFDGFSGVTQILGWLDFESDGVPGALPPNRGNPTIRVPRTFPADPGIVAETPYRVNLDENLFPTAAHLEAAALLVDWRPLFLGLAPSPNDSYAIRELPGSIRGACRGGLVGRYFPTLRRRLFPPECDDGLPLVQEPYDPATGSLKLMAVADLFITPSLLWIDRFELREVTPTLVVGVLIERTGALPIPLEERKELVRLLDWVAALLEEGDEKSAAAAASLLESYVGELKALVSQNALRPRTARRLARLAREVQFLLESPQPPTDNPSG